MGFGDKRIAIIGGGLGRMAFANAALYAGLTNIQLYGAIVLVLLLSLCETRALTNPFLAAVFNSSQGSNAAAFRKAEQEFYIHP